jgi:hypothetical protein
MDLLSRIVFIPWRVRGSVASPLSQAKIEVDDEWNGDIPSIVEDELGFVMIHAERGGGGGGANVMAKEEDEDKEDEVAEDDDSDQATSDDRETIPSRDPSPFIAPPPPPPLTRPRAEIRSMCPNKEDGCFCYLFEETCKRVTRQHAEVRSMCPNKEDRCFCRLTNEACKRGKRSQCKRHIKGCLCNMAPDIQCRGAPPPPLASARRGAGGAVGKCFPCCGDNAVSQ